MAKKVVECVICGLAVQQSRAFNTKRKPMCKLCFRNIHNLEMMGVDDLCLLE